MVRMVGQDTIHSGIVGFELRSGCSFGAAHLRLRTGVLFRDLPAFRMWFPVWEASTKRTVSAILRLCHG